MSTSRRGFLAGMLALGAAPAIVKASSLMKLATPPNIIVPDWRLVVQPMYQHVRNLPILIEQGVDFDGDTSSRLGRGLIKPNFLAAEEVFVLTQALPLLTESDSIDLDAHNRKNLSLRIQPNAETSDLVWRPKVNRIIVGNSSRRNHVL